VAGKMSPYEQRLRTRLGQKNSAWPREFDRCLERVRPALAELRGKGGDADFALFVLTNYHWRQVVPAGPEGERDALVDRIDQLLGNQGMWARHMRQSVTWKAAEEGLRRAKDRLESSRPHDMSAFESTHTDRMTASRRWTSDHSYTCLWALDWHLRQLPKVRRIRRRLLGDLLFLFGFLGNSSDPEVLVAQRLRRNPRVRTGHRVMRNFTLAHLISMYHAEHSMAATACGPLCNAWPDVLSFKPPTKADRLTEKALELERKGKHARAAECYRAARERAERALGTDHGYVTWILVRYWLALRHAGQHAKARRIKPQADAMWAKYGQGHLSD
jgi:hypothetical protein